MSGFSVAVPPEGIDRVEVAKRRKLLFRNAAVQEAYADCAPSRSQQLQLARDKKQSLRHSAVVPPVESIVRPQLFVPSGIVGLLTRAASSAHATTVRMPLMAHHMHTFKLFRSGHLPGTSSDAANRMTRAFVGERARTVVSKSALAESIHVDRKSCSSYLLVLANNIVHADRAAKAWTFSAITATLNPACLIECCDAERADETPMPLSRKDRSAPTCSSVANLIDQNVGSSTAIVAPCVGSTSSATHLSAKAACKLFQRESLWGMVFQLPTGVFVHLISSTLNWLQMLDRTTGEVYTEAFKRTACSPPQSSMFQGSSRVLCNDQASGIERSEAHLDKELPGVKRLQLNCELHVAHIGHTNTADLAKDLGVNIILIMLACMEYFVHAEHDYEAFALCHQPVHMCVLHCTCCPHRRSVSSS
jgi:hypothetical protein